MSKEYKIHFARQVQEMYNCRIIINEEEPYCLFCVSDIGVILEIKNIRTTVLNYEKIVVKINSKGGKQNTTFITYDDLIKLLVKSRKPNVVDFCNKLNLDITSKIYTCIEADTLKCIIDAFQGEEMLSQYKINSYLVDLYFPKYKLIIECDECQHKLISNIEKDLLRETQIKEVINDCVFIRYDPTARDFNIFKVINKIYQILK